MKSANLQLEKLILVGYRKNYKVKFFPGVNIIYGDSDTGKSSILKIINYLLGASKLDMYKQLETSVSHACLELKINEDIYTIVRDIHSPNKLIEVYLSNYAEKDKVFPTKYAPNFNPSEYEPFSDFLLEAFGFPKIKIKQSPTKPDSKMNRVSFRDIFKYCYLDQDSVGSSTMLNIGDFVKMTKNAEVFKYIFNLLDDSISKVQEEIGIEVNKRKVLQNEYNVIEKFFEDVDFISFEEMNNKIEELDGFLDELKINLSRINEQMTSSPNNLIQSKNLMRELEASLKIVRENKYDALSAIKRYSNLKNDYLEDISKLKLIKESKKFIDVHEVNTCICPLCENEMPVESANEKFNVDDSNKISFEINSLQRRIRSLNKLIDDQRQNYSYQEKQETEQLKSLNSYVEMIDSVTSEFVSPYIAERDQYVQQISKLNNQKEEIAKHRKIRNQQNQILKKISVIENILKIKKDKLAELTEHTADIAQVRSFLIGNLYNFLKEVKINDISETDLDRYNLPMLRGKSYSDISSGGVRTVVSVGYYCSILKLSLKVGANIPTFLMLDTIGKYIGKNSVNDEQGMSDPSKYQSLYESILDLVDYAEDNNNQCQILIVDNDVPEKIMKEFSGHIIERFSPYIKSDGYKIGLIDDYIEDGNS